MYAKRFIGQGALLTSLLCSTAAQADVTAEQVWETWTAYYSEMGHSITAASQEKSGDTLVVSGVALANTMPDGKFDMSIAEVRLKELGDGTVEMTMSEEMPLTMTSLPETGETVEMKMVVTNTDLSTIVSGDPDAMTFDMTAPEIGLKMDGMTVDGEVIELVVDVAMRGSTGSYTMSGSAPRAITSNFSSEGVTFDVSAKDPESSGTFKLNGEMASLTGTSEMTMPGGVDMSDMDAALKAGFTLAGALSYASATYALDFQDGSESVQANGTGGEGKIDLGLSPKGMNYSASSESTEIAVTSSDLPFPVNISLGSSAFGMMMPLLKSDEPQQFNLLTKLVDLKISDEIWSMIDPAAQMPRDPATLIIDVAGSVKLLADLMDPATTEMGAPPGEIESLDVNEVKLSAVGSELTGDGGFTFDNTDMSMGYPKPLGELNLALTGGNALMDKLVAMGLLPEDQAMGARMMMGMFTVSNGDDSLTSKIEFRDDGGLYANGQRLQ